MRIAALALMFSALFVAQGANAADPHLLGKRTCSGAFYGSLHTLELDGVHPAGHLLGRISGPLLNYTLNESVTGGSAHGTLQGSSIVIKTSRPGTFTCAVSPTALSCMYRGVTRYRGVESPSETNITFSCRSA